MSRGKTQIEKLIAENAELKKQLAEYKLANADGLSTLLHNEDSFIHLFDEMTSASALHKMVFDDQGNPVDYIFIRVNKMFEAFTGLKAKNIIGKTVLAVIPDLEQSWIERYGQVVITGEPVEFENYVQALDHYYSIRAYRPQAGYFVVTFIDITERKKSELAINETKLFYEQILESSHDGIWVTDSNDVIIYANTGMAKIAGIECSQIVGKHLANDFEEETLVEFLPYYQKVKKTGNPVEYEANILTPAGRKTVQSGWLIPIIKNGGLDGIICSSQDITSKKLAEENLANSEFRLLNIVENLNGFVYRCKYNSTWTTLYMSSGIKNLSGYDAEEFVENRNISFNDIIHPDDLFSVDEQILDAVSRDLQYFLEYRIITKEGKIKWVYEQGSGVKNSLKELSHLEGYIFDISERKNMEKEILEKNKEIAAQNEEYLTVNEELQATIEQIRAINEELTVAKIKAEESDRLKSAFLANMSHEIRTPMNSILGFSGLMVEGSVNKQKRNWYGRLILSAGEHLLRIIDDIVDIAKIESNQLKIEMSNQNLVALLNDVYTFHGQGNLIRQKPQITIKLDVSKISDDCSLLTDPVRFKQIINNLITNAIKFTQKGEVVFGIENIDTTNHKIEFFVKDTGIGIPPEGREIIFERFMQLRGNDPSPGTGLGLSITKGILNLMGGDIRLESELNKGTTFYFSLPFNENKTDEYQIIDTKKSFRIPDLTNKLVYIAEDNPGSYFLLQEILEMTNAQVKLAKNGRQLIDLVLQQTPDLILADINMPDVSGIEAVKEIRRLGYLVPVIAQTAYALLEEKESCLKAGCSAYISKPIDANLLFELINQNISSQKEPSFQP